MTKPRGRFECTHCGKDVGPLGKLYRCLDDQCPRSKSFVCADCTVMRTFAAKPPPRQENLKPALYLQPWFGFCCVATAFITIMLLGLWARMCFATNAFVWILALSALGYYAYRTKLLSNDIGRWNTASTAQAHNAQARWDPPRRCCKLCQQETSAAE